ncbi:hypothetical protein [Acinetobacter sp. ANC 4654]|uniref:hypothetical protein n=1 Tax=Acinetobacter sp. ANC 4654 TaxID=1977872 RepID=UPI001177ECDD|nr:hypothetical protein [Acinetobacter sp. ANC 4654]
MIDLINLKRQQMKLSQYSKITIHCIGNCASGSVIFGWAEMLSRQRLMKINGLKWAIPVAKVILLEMIYIEKVIL